MISTIQASSDPNESKQGMKKKYIKTSKQNDFRIITGMWHNKALSETKQN